MLLLLGVFFWGGGGGSFLKIIAVTVSLLLPRNTVKWCTLSPLPPPPPTIICIDPCLLIFIQDKQEKDFIVCHSQTVFELLDEDGNSNISAQEFEGFSFLFNFEGRAVKQIFYEFDVSGKQVRHLVRNKIAQRKLFTKVQS